MWKREMDHGEVRLGVCEACWWYLGCGLVTGMERRIFLNTIDTMSLIPQLVLVFLAKYRYRVRVLRANVDGRTA